MDKMPVRDRDVVGRGIIDERDGQGGRFEMLEMPANGVDEIDKMRDGNEPMRWSR